LALSYSSRWEITEAAKALAADVKDGKIDAGNITEETFASYLNTAEIPDPELMIRTSGEYRISNYLLWQLAYSELYFTPKLWPDFRREDLFEAVIDFQKRERRFGMTSEQLN
jgi:undecaprenyl diphosphate synthase